MAALTEIAALLHRAGRVLALTHVSPDGDAIGSLLGFGWLLRRAWQAEPDAATRSLVLACADPVPPQFQWLPGADDIVREPPAGPWDAVVALDASDALRLGAVLRPEQIATAPLIVLDHHITNLRFGAFNYVDPTAAATAQIVVGLADALGVEIGLEAATCLLVGLVTDTLGFRTTNVTVEVMATAMRLMRVGVSLSEITERALNHRPLSLLRLWGLALTTLRLEQGVAWASISQAMRSQVNAPVSGDGSLVSQLIHAPEAAVAAVFAETPEGNVEVSLRARAGYDVSQVALRLGGGGHPQAAGCTIPGPLAAAEARVLPLLFQLTAEETTQQ